MANLYVIVRDEYKWDLMWLGKGSNQGFTFEEAKEKILTYIGFELQSNSEMTRHIALWFDLTEEQWINLKNGVLND